MPINPASPPCILGDEGPQEGAVPHHLPGKTPFVDELTNLYGIPPEATLGGAETMYPVFRKKIKDEFVMPAKCTLKLRRTGAPGPVAHVPIIRSGSSGRDSPLRRPAGALGNTTDPCIAKTR